MIIDIKGEFVGGPRCGLRFPITAVVPPEHVTVDHLDPRFAALGPVYDYRLTLEPRPDMDSTTGAYRYVYVKPEKVGA